MEGGKRFSLVYLERTKPARDSKRFRNRLGSWVSQKTSGALEFPIADAIRRETGACVPHYIDKFFIESEVRDVLYQSP